MKSLVNGMRTIHVHPVPNISIILIASLTALTSLPSYCENIPLHPSSHHNNASHNSPRRNSASPTTTNHPPLKNNLNLRTLSIKNRIIRTEETSRSRQTRSQKENHGRAGRGASSENVWSRRGWRRSWCRVGGWPGTFDQ